MTTLLADAGTRPNNKPSDDGLNPAKSVSYVPSPPPSVAVVILYTYAHTLYYFFFFDADRFKANFGSF